MSNEGPWGRRLLLPVAPDVPSWNSRYLATEADRGSTLLLQMCPVQVKPFTRAVREGMGPYMEVPEDQWGICLTSGWLKFQREMH